ncbi:hypothetical protein [Bradyrhizobium yuanmingense]|uniref:hypothetical protein n=1 Tax=Bradyrhizobium yuanmingense TaxID=108015 RepID=UPI003D2F0E6E
MRRLRPGDVVMVSALNRLTRGGVLDSQRALKHHLAGRCLQIACGGTGDTTHQLERCLPPCKLHRSETKGTFFVGPPWEGKGPWCGSDFGGSRR